MTDKFKDINLELKVSKDNWLTDYDMSQEIKNSPDRKVAIFGGGKVQKGSYYYNQAQLFAKNIASAGISVMTGGGPGIMDAGNSGATMASSNASSYGIRVKTIVDEITDTAFYQKLYEFDTLSVRMLTLISSCDVAVLFPGGFGTLEELFSILVRTRVKLMEKKPVYLFCRSFWSGLTNWIENTLLQENMINKEDTSSYQILDNVDELSEKVINHIKSLD